MEFKFQEEIADIYRRYCQEHDDQLFLSEDRVADECIGEACKASPSLLDEGIICCNVLSIDCRPSALLSRLAMTIAALTGNALRRKQRQLSEWISFM